MASDPDPPELARLLDFAERSRKGDWSLRSALVRYAQANPMRVSQVLDNVRRIEFGLQPHGKEIVREGPGLWAAVEAGRVPDEQPAHLIVGILLAAVELDRLGDRLATWADDRSTPDPGAAVDEVVGDVAGRLDALGVEREERRPPARRRKPGSGG